MCHGILIPLDSVQVANFEYVGEEETLKQAEGDKDAEDLDPDAKAKYWDELLKQRYEEPRNKAAQEPHKPAKKDASRSTDFATTHNVSWSTDSATPHICESTPIEADFGYRLKPTQLELEGAC